jgi:hypothetical protein
VCLYINTQRPSFNVLMTALKVFANAKPELRVFFTQTLTFR